MAAKNRRTIPALIQALHRTPERFDFFQAVRLLEATLDSDRAELDSIRLRPHASLGFPKADLHDFKWEQGKANPRAELVTNFMGLYGTSTPLPHQVSQRILGAKDSEPPLRRFLDVFNHRLLWLYYEAWKKYRHDIGFGTDGRDSIGKRFLNLCGIGDEAIARQLPVSRDQLLPRIGLLTLCSRSPSSLAELLCGLMPELPPLRVREFEYRAVPIVPSQRTRLGQRRMRLGNNMVIGSHAPDVTGAVRLVLGPMSYEDYLSYRPGTPKRRKLIAITRYLITDPLDIKITSILRDEEAQGVQLGHPRRAALGTSMWLGEPSGRVQAITE
ncbi:MAG: type VI secretion system baseplate subunit TssG [Pseudomonadota bacterium]